MKTIIAGSRKLSAVSDKCKDMNLYDMVKEAVRLSGFEITHVISGGAAGIDQIGERWANENGIPITRFLPDWAMFGKLAGSIRNGQMVEKSDALIAIWDGLSKGTEDVIRRAERNRIKTYVFRVDF